MPGELLFLHCNILRRCTQFADIKTFNTIRTCNIALKIASAMSKSGSEGFFVCWKPISSRPQALLLWPWIDSNLLVLPGIDPVILAYV